MYKVFLKFPDALRPAFPRLKEKLEDPDPGWNELIRFMFVIDFDEQNVMNTKFNWGVDLTIL